MYSYLSRKNSLNLFELVHFLVEALLEEDGLEAVLVARHAAQLVHELVGLAQRVSRVVDEPVRLVLLQLTTTTNTSDVSTHQCMCISYPASFVCAQR